MCKYYRVVKLLGKAVKKGNEVAAKTSSLAKEGLLKVKEGWNAQQNKGKVTNASSKQNKGVSFFQKAVKSFRDIAADIAADIKEDSGTKSTNPDVATVSEVNEVNTNPTLLSESLDDNDTTSLSDLEKGDFIALDVLDETVKRLSVEEWEEGSEKIKVGLKRECKSRVDCCCAVVSVS